jgi:CBS-domain-containing membrane protein
MHRTIIWLHRAVGAGIAIGVMELLARWDGEPLLRVPFVTSIVLVTAVPEIEAARPAAVIFGHLLSSVAGLIALWTLGANEFATAAGVGLATLLMLATRTLHPPAGINAFLVPANALSAWWILNPVLLGSILLAAFARLWRLSERALRRQIERRQWALPPAAGEE